MPASLRMVRTRSSDKKPASRRHSWKCPCSRDTSKLSYAWVSGLRSVNTNSSRTVLFSPAVELSVSLKMGSVCLGENKSPAKAACTIPSTTSKSRPGANLRLEFGLSFSLTETSDRADGMVWSYLQQKWYSSLALNWWDIQPPDILRDLTVGFICSKYLIILGDSPSCPRMLNSSLMFEVSQVSAFNRRVGLLRR